MSGGLFIIVGGREGGWLPARVYVPLKALFLVFHTRIYIHNVYRGLEITDKFQIPKLHFLLVIKLIFLKIFYFPGQALRSVMNHTINRENIRPI